jgi:hypothetical protein
MVPVRDAGRPDKPVVVVRSVVPGDIEDAVLAGIEEEGVPQVVERVDDGSAAALAQAAAARSPLGVGVGIDVYGQVCVHPEKLAEPLPALTSTGPAETDVARALGHNAARIVVGLPLKAVTRQ